MVSFPSRPAAPGPPGRKRRHPLNSDHAYTENRTDPPNLLRPPGLRWAAALQLSEHARLQVGSLLSVMAALQEQLDAVDGERVCLILCVGVV